MKAMFCSGYHDTVSLRRSQSGQLQSGSSSDRHEKHEVGAGSMFLAPGSVEASSIAELTALQYDLAMSRCAAMPDCYTKKNSQQ